MNTAYTERTAERVCLMTAFDVCDPADVRTAWHEVGPETGIGDLVADADFFLDDGLELEVRLNGRVLSLAEADTVVLRGGWTVCLRVIPAGGGGGGGGSNPLQIVAMVAVVALSIAAPYLAPASWGLLAAGGGLTLAGTLVSAGVMIGGSLLVNALFPPVTPSLGSGFGIGNNAIDESATYSWQSQSNPTAQGGVIPIVQGACAGVKPYQLCSYISTDGEKQYYNALYLVAEGEVDEIYDVKINENPASNYSNVTLTTRLGTAEQTVIPEFNDVVQETSVGVKMTTEWHTVLFSGTGLSRIGLGLNATSGLYYANDGGGLDPVSVTVTFQIRVDGAAVWKDFLTMTLRDARRAAVMQYKEAAVQRITQSYEVRGRITGEPSANARTQKDVYWEYYHEIVDDDFRLPHCALLAVKALPTESLNGGKPAITCGVKRMHAMLPDADGVYQSRPLSNPAWAVLEMALAQRYGVGELAENMDAASFAEAAAWCDAKNISGGLYIDAAMTFETFMGYWGQLGRFTCDRVGTRLVCISDRPQEYPDAAFLVTSADIDKGTLDVSYPALEDRADGFEITYFDDTRGKTAIFVPGTHFWKDQDRPPNVTSVTLYPCRNENVAYKAGVYMNRCNQYLTRTVSLTVGWKAMGDHLRRGRVFQLAADMLINTQSGLVASATASTVTLNRKVMLMGGTGYELVLSHNAVLDERTGEPLVEKMPLATVATDVETDTLTLSAPLAYVPEKDASCAVGRVNRSVRWYRVTSLTQTSDLRVTITGLEYDEAVYADEGGTPNVNSAGDWPAVSGLTAAVLSVIEDGLDKQVVSLSWRGYAFGWKIFWWRLGVDTDWKLAGSTANPGYIVRNLDVGYIYRFSVTATNNALDGQTVDLDYRLSIGSGVVDDVYVDDIPVAVMVDGVEETLQTLI